ncbi:MAG: hypothetical protein FWF10_11415, partial [Clostridiales bacterium]|nr:hypothetical protein [Clostridiales bacterium]
YPNAFAYLPRATLLFISPFWTSLLRSSRIVLTPEFTFAIHLFEILTQLFSYQLSALGSQLLVYGGCIVWSVDAICCVARLILGVFYCPVCEVCYEEVFLGFCFVALWGSAFGLRACGVW